MNLVTLVCLVNPEILVFLVNLGFLVILMNRMILLGSQMSPVNLKILDSLEIQVSLETLVSLEFQVNLAFLVYLGIPEIQRIRVILDNYLDSH